jgi:hypothetical protein
MIKKGKIAAKKNNKVKVFYEDINTMTPYIDVAAHISMTDLVINDKVIVAIYDDNLRTGAVIGVIK